MSRQEVGQAHRSSSGESFYITAHHVQLACGDGEIRRNPALDLKGGGVVDLSRPVSLFFCLAVVAKGPPRDPPRMAAASVMLMLSGPVSW